MANVLTLIRQSGFSELACQFAAYIERLDNSNEPLLPITAALLSEASTEGHVCLNLETAIIPEVLAEFIPEHQQWLQGLMASNVVTEVGGYAPLVLNEFGQLYLYRYWQHEQDVAVMLLERGSVKVEFDADRLKADFQQWQSSVEGTDWQKIAVLMGLTQGLAVISGGPGTGKTTIVNTLLTFLHHQHADCRVALAAPTGKAAARLQQATADNPFTFEVKTIHRLLGITPNREQGRYSAERPLPADVVIIDEASMIDISLMSTLLKALSSHTRLILLGDSQQLASVESGAVLANLCQQSVQFNSEFIALAAQCGIDGLVRQDNDSFLNNQLVQLQHSYRFSQDSLIWKLAEQVNQGEVNTALSLLTESGVWHSADDAAILNCVLNGYDAFFKAVETKQAAKTILANFEQFRLLAAVKQGPQSVDAVHRLIHRHLMQRGWRTQHDFYLGRPIMITHNDYRQQLFNGDIGVVLHDEDGQLKACFCFDEELRWIPLNRLPAHDTAFAMTVHKSQGSEFAQVAILLPEAESPLLNRELLYTAITRAKTSFSLLSNSDVLTHTIQTKHIRHSGLNRLFSFP